MAKTKEKFNQAKFKKIDSLINQLREIKLEDKDNIEVLICGTVRVADENESRIGFVKSAGTGMFVLQALDNFAEHIHELMTRDFIKDIKDSLK